MSGSSSEHRSELFLIPNLLGESSIDDSLPPLIREVVSRLHHFVVEDEKSARKFIKLVAPDVNLRALSLRVLNVHTASHEVDCLLAPLLQGHSIGVLSEAGCPGVADPGAEITRRAHAMGIPVRPLVGPCSMILALMASGFNGQRWRFLGYLPIEGDKRRERILALERDVLNNQETQIVMETPYRNQKLFEEIIATCRPETRLCVASALTTPTESIKVRSIREWRTETTTIPKSPTLFLVGA